MKLTRSDGLEVTLAEIRADLEAAKNSGRFQPRDYCFTYVTVEALVQKLEELDPEKPFTLYWMGGKREVIYGADIADAFSKAGYGGGAMGALDFHATGDNKEYKWDTKKKEWKAVRRGVGS